MRAVVQSFLFLSLLFGYPNRAGAGWAEDSAGCKQKDERALQPCLRLIVNGDKSDAVYLQVAQLYEMKFELIIAKELFSLVREKNPSNTEADFHYKRLMEDPNLAIQEINQKGWLK